MLLRSNFQIKQKFLNYNFPVSNEFSSVLVTRVLSNNLWNMCKRLFKVRPETLSWKRQIY